MSSYSQGTGKPRPRQHDCVDIGKQMTHLRMATWHSVAITQLPRTNTLPSPFEDPIQCFIAQLSQKDVEAGQRSVDEDDGRIR